MSLPALRILVIEDETADYLLLGHHLRHSGLMVECEQVATDEALAGALQRSWDVVLCDYHVPGMALNGTLRRIRAQCPDLPVILVYGAIGEEAAVALLQLGLADFILKESRRSWYRVSVAIAVASACAERPLGRPPTRPRFSGPKTRSSSRTKLAQRSLLKLWAPPHCW